MPPTRPALPPATPAHALLSAARSLLRPADTIATNKPPTEKSPTPEPVLIAASEILPIEESLMPEPGFSDLKDVVEAINKLCETMTTYQATESEHVDQIHVETDLIQPDQVTATSEHVYQPIISAVVEVQHVEPLITTPTMAIDQTVLATNETTLEYVKPQHPTRAAPAIPARYREAELSTHEEVEVVCVEPEYPIEVATAVRTRCYDTSELMDPEQVTVSVVETFGYDATELVNPEEVTVQEVATTADNTVVQSESSVVQEVEAFGSQGSIIDPMAVQNESSVIEGGGSRWSDVPSEQYYTASSEVSLVSDSSDVLPVTSGHVAAMRERFENLTRAPDRSASPVDPERLGG